MTESNKITTKFKEWYTSNPAHYDYDDILYWLQPYDIIKSDKAGLVAEIYKVLARAFTAGYEASKESE